MPSEKKTPRIPHNATPPAEKAEAQDIFLRSLAQAVPLHQSAAIAGKGLSTLHEWAEKDDEFRARWVEAYEAGTGVLEGEMLRRGVEGVDEPVFQGGKQIGTRKKYSDRLLEMALKSRRPDVYGDRMKLEGGVRPAPGPQRIASSRESGPSPERDAAMKRAREQKSLPATTDQETTES